MMAPSAAGGGGGGGGGGDWIRGQSVQHLAGCPVAGRSSSEQQAMWTMPGISTGMVPLCCYPMVQVSRAELANAFMAPSAEMSMRMRDGGSGSGSGSETVGAAPEPVNNEPIPPHVIGDLLNAYLSDICWTHGASSRQAGKSFVKKAHDLGVFGKRALNALISFFSSNTVALQDESRFCAFYRLTFLLARDRGVNTLDARTAAIAWSVLLRNRFALLNEWSTFVSNTREYITEDTWRQVLDFCTVSRNGLSEYDPNGAWPVLIDDFVEHVGTLDERRWQSVGDSVGVSPSADNDGMPVDNPTFEAEHQLSSSRADMSPANKRKLDVVVGNGRESVDDLAVRLALMEADSRQSKHARFVT